MHNYFERVKNRCNGDTGAAKRNKGIVSDGEFYLSVGIAIELWLARPPIVQNPKGVPEYR